MTKLGTLAIISLLALGVVACNANDPAQNDGNDSPGDQQTSAGGGGNGSASNLGGSAGATNQGGGGGSAAACDAPEQGTGKQVGDLIANVTWDAPGNTQLVLHSFCGKAKAVWMVLSAGWCEPCKAMAPQYDKLFLKYREQGLEVVLVVGENASGNAATVDYAATYKEALKLNDDVHVVADPHFSKLDGAATPGQFLPGSSYPVMSSSIRK